MDIAIATEVSGLDVVVGGHTDTFLYTGWFKLLIGLQCLTIIISLDAPSSNLLFFKWILFYSSYYYSTAVFCASIFH